MFDTENMGPLDLCNLSYSSLILSLPDTSFFDIVFEKSRGLHQLHFNDLSVESSPTTSFSLRAFATRYLVYLYRAIF